jgi:hypothetical protein
LIKFFQKALASAGVLFVYGREGAALIRAHLRCFKGESNALLKGRKQACLINKRSALSSEAPLKAKRPPKQSALKAQHPQNNKKSTQKFA